jgi:hypothetical protein
MAQAGTGFSLQRPVFNARPGHVEFVMHIFKMYFTTQLTNLQVISFGFSVKPSSDLFTITSHIKKLYLHMGLRSNSLTIYVIKIYVRE